jgi:hypothetical protein
MSPDGHLQKLVADLTPPGPNTEFAQDGCYLNSDQNCSPGLTGEHYVSRAVLQGIGEQIEIRGMPWLLAGSTRRVGVNNLTANVLCARHNSALSPLDEEAAHFADCLQETHKALSTRSLSRRTTVHMFSGEAIELWCLKVTCGICTSFATRNGVKVKTDHTLDLTKASHAFFKRQWDKGAGLYLRAALGTSVVGRPQVSMTPLFSDQEKRIVGARIWLFGLEFDLLFDMTNIGPQPGYAHRPSSIEFRNERRSRFIALTWPRATPRNPVQLTAGPLVRP